LHYIQELQGHSSNKTTGIYTNDSAKNLQNHKNPFDDFQQIVLPLINKCNFMVPTQKDRLVC